MRTPRQAPGEVLGLIDIGTSKIVCLIVALEPRGPSILAGMHMPFRVLGIGHQRSRGLKAGVITDLDQAEVAVRAAVDQAESMAGVTLQDVFVSVACGRLRSETFAANADVDGGIVADRQIARVLDGARAYAERDGRMLVHLNRVGYRLDGAPGGRDPRGLAASQITLDMHTVTADDAPVRNLMLLIDRCYLGVAGLIVSPFASALAATSVEERRLGVTVIDIGGGVTSIALFADGRFVHADTLPIGGNHATYDIARGLQTPLAEAERIKALYGTLSVAPSDGREAFSYPLAGEEPGAVAQITKAQLGEILRPRMASLVALVNERLEQCGLRSWVGDRVVLTGGASQLIGAGEFVANQLGRPVRVSGPDGAAALPGSIAVPAFSTVVGMVASAAAGEGLVAARQERNVLTGGYFGRVGAWLREGF
ncbi:MAG: cell division protein FtsA [Hyphomicrobiaceae bacterium]|nr:cell division protein FtsA [Hyphomicrobiaceae bacterium]